MSQMRLVLSLLALGGGVAILGMSLLTVTPAQSATGAFEASQRQLYFSEEILPDHIGYPLLMAMDRARLETAVPSERVYIQIEYGTRRLQYATELLKKDNHPLAVTTASKGYKYLLQAGQESLDEEMTDNVRSYALKALEFHLKEMSAFQNELTDAERANIDQYREQGQILAKQLRDSLTEK